MSIPAGFRGSAEIDGKRYVVVEWELGPVEAGIGVIAFPGLVTGRVVLANPESGERKTLTMRLGAGGVAP